jgi:hypothetical protein
MAAKGTTCRREAGGHAVRIRTPGRFPSNSRPARSSALRMAAMVSGSPPDFPISMFEIVLRWMPAIAA